MLVASSAAFADGTINDNPKVMINSVYPNPALSELNIDLRLANEGTIVVRFYNVIGKEIEHRNFNAQKGTNIVNYDVSLLPKGTYLVRCSHTMSSTSNRMACHANDL